MDSGWRRDTRVCATIDLRPDLLTAIRAHLALHELDTAEAQALVCFETESRRTKKRGLLERLSEAPKETMTNAVIVTPTRLIWAQAADEGEPYVTSELLGGLEVTDYEESAGYTRLPDSGLWIRGVTVSSGRTGTLFFGLGEGPDADRARYILKAAVKAAHGEGPPVEA
jgi:hypothetical protein